MKQQKSIARLRVLYDNIISYRKAGFSGVEYEDPEIKHLWEEYLELRKILIELNPELFSDLREISMPKPDVASSFGYYSPGTLLYYSKHFSQLENEAIKAIEYTKMIDKNTSESTSVVKGSINVTAHNGSSINLTIGNNNTNSQAITNKINEVYEKLEKLGVDANELNSLKEIVNEKQLGKTDKNGIAAKIMGWISSVAAKVAEKGITENLPLIIDKAQSLIEMVV